jgi:hypothetical protein
MSFADASVTTTSETSSEVTVKSNDSQLAHPVSSGFEGEWGVSDVEVPRLSIIQPTSGTVSEFPSHIGEFLHDKHVPLGENIKVIFLRFVKKLQEVKEFDETMPLTFDTLAEAKAAGVPAREMAIVTLAIEVDKDHPAYESSLVEDNDKGYLVVEWFLQGRSYGLARTVQKDVMSSFKGSPVYSRFYEVESEKKPARGKPFRVPKPRLAGPVPKSVIDKFVESGFIG